MTGPTEPLYLNDTTVEIPRVPAAEPAPAVPRRSFWRGLAGALTAGMVLLTLVVLGVQILAWVKGFPGPGLLVLIGHAVATVIALVAQRSADRRGGVALAGAVLVVLVATAAAIWSFWWA